MNSQAIAERGSYVGILAMYPEARQQQMRIREDRRPSASDFAEEDGDLTRAEHVAIAGLLAAILVLRVVYCFRYAPNSDESQHLHVVWGWTRGLVQYRDLFDNHMPLFHLLFAPVVWLVGERADALCFARLALLPLFALSLLAVFWIGRALFSPRVGAWSAVLTALLPPFFFCSLEFRADALWATLWLLALAVFFAGPPSVVRWLPAGALLGASLAVSIKSTCLVIGLCGAVGLTAAVAPSALRCDRRAPLQRSALAALAGFLVVPGLVLLVLRVAGAWASFRNDVLAHNSPLTGYLSPPSWARPILLLAVALLAYGAVRRLQQATTGRRGAAPPETLWLAGLLSFGCLVVLSPIVNRQDYLPFLPIAAIAAVAWVARGYGTSVSRFGSVRRRLLGLVAGCEVVWLLAAAPPWSDGMAAQTQLVRDVLTLTGRAEPVMDAKGESVFRRRPFHLVLDRMTIAGIDRGLVRDTIPEDLTRTRTHVVIFDETRFPDRATEFIRANYLPLDRLWVAGQMLWLGARAGPCAMSFEIRIRGRYAIVAPGRFAGGTLDDRKYVGPRVLRTGPHEIRMAACQSPIAVVWSRAITRGFSPFPPLADGSLASSVGVTG